MPSGKQTSFTYGEISPEQQYRSTESQYARALFSLRNMTVKREGGVTKIPGTSFAKFRSEDNVNVSQEPSSIQRIKIFSFPYIRPAQTGPYRSSKSVLGKIVFRIEDDSDYEVIIDFYADPYSDTPTRTFESLAFFSYSVEPGRGLENIQVTYGRNELFIHGMGDWSAGTIANKYNCLMRMTGLDTALPSFFRVEPPAIPSLSFPNASQNVTIGSGAVAFAVQYLVTVEYFNGFETPYSRFVKSDSGGSPYNSSGFLTGAIDGQDMVLPGNNVLMGFQLRYFFTGGSLKLIKRINIYRSAVSLGTEDDFSSMVLVSRVSPRNVIENNAPLDDMTSYPWEITLNDSGASVPSITPPLDFSMYTDNPGLDGVPGFPTSYIIGSSCSAVYQERHIVGFNQSINKSIGPSGMLASKAGGLSQLEQPIINSLSGAFSLSIPVSDGSPVRQIIGTERLMVFSDNGAYLVQGGDNGILTPTTINPIKISSEGASKVVTPLISGSSVVYLNSRHTKLMVVLFGDQYRAATAEVSGWSSHLFNGEEFLEMEMLPGSDNTILLLKKDGNIITATINSDGEAGFSTLDMNEGKVESMCSVGDPDKPSLMLVVVRNGIRVYESIEAIADQNRLKTECYSNTTISAGKILLPKTDKGYRRISYLSSSKQDSNDILDDAIIHLINITTQGADYNEGTLLEITTSVPIPDYVVNKRIRVYYTDDTGMEASLDFILTAITGVFSYDAYAYGNVPEGLQDLATNALGLSDAEVKARRSRWLPLFKTITSTDITSEIGRLYSLGKEGTDISFAADPKIVPAGEVPVAIFADDAVISSPLNPRSDTISIIKDADSLTANITLDLGEYRTRAFIGFPYESSMQTLPIESSDGRTLSDDNKIVDKVGIALYNTIGGFVGNPDKSLEDMDEMVTRDNVDIADASAKFSGYISPNIGGEWSTKGMVKIRHVDPAPITVLAVFPKGLAGD